MTTAGAIPTGEPGRNVAWPPPRAEREGVDGRHLLIRSDAGPELQLLSIDGADADAALAAVIPFGPDLPARLSALLAGWNALNGQPPPDPLTPQRRRRLILGLRALDGRAGGASYRKVAAGLFGADRVPAGAAWKAHDLRSRTLRLVADATALMRGGYRALVGLPAA